MPIGPLELVIILVIVLVLFGATRLPQVGKGLGTGLREFKDSVTGSSRDREDLPAGDDEDDALPKPRDADSEAATPSSVGEKHRD